MCKKKGKTEKQTEQQKQNIFRYKKTDRDRNSCNLKIDSAERYFLIQKKKAGKISLCRQILIIAVPATSIATQQKQYDNDPAAVYVTTSMLHPQPLFRTGAKDDDQEYCSKLFPQGKSPAVITSICVTSAAIIVTAIASVFSTTCNLPAAKSLHVKSSRFSLHSYHM